MVAEEVSTGATASAAQPLTAVAIATRRRPEALDRLLRVLATEYGPQKSISLVVIDNDPLGSSRKVVEELRARFVGPVIYRVEPQEGFASVRNASVAAAAGVEYVVFIDDDEVPEPGWLNQLHDARQRFGADVVAGVTIAEFPPGTPGWFRKSGVMSSEQPKLETGASMMWCATGNTLVAYSVFESIPEWFDVRFDATGGEDTHFFSRAHTAGFRIIWTNDARVRELIPLQRTKTSWILRRAARTGNNKALIAIEVLRSPQVIAVRMVKAAAMLVIGASLTGLGVCRRDRGLALRGLQRCAEGAGTILGFLGVRLG
jgi:glycosyltransferase involved in cell wall biosynthesis